MKRIFFAAGIAAACLWLAASLAGCAQTKYYQLTDKRTGEISYSTVLPEAEPGAAAHVPASQSLIGQRRGVSEHYIVREITRSEYQQRRTESAAGDSKPE